MSNPIGYLLLFFLLLLEAYILVEYPSLITDKNRALKAFIENQLLSILGVVMAITAASASNITLNLRKMEALYNDECAFKNTREQVKIGAYALIILFVIATVVILSKSLVEHNILWTGIANSLALFIFFWNVLVLISLLELSFNIRPINFDD